MTEAIPNPTLRLIGVDPFGQLYQTEQSIPDGDFTGAWTHLTGITPLRP